MKKAPKAKIGDIIIFSVSGGTHQGKAVKAGQGLVTASYFVESMGWLYFCGDETAPADAILESDILAVNAIKMGFEAFSESAIPDNVVP